MVTIRFSTVPEVLVEEAGTSIAPHFQLDEIPPAGGLTTTIKGNVPQSLAGHTIDPVNSAIVQSTDRRSDIQDRLIIENVITGTNQSDRLVGTNQRDWMQGGRGGDLLIGGAGGDVLRGGAGSDGLRGDGGNDVFSLQKGAGVDTILDFRDNRDRIDIAANVSFEQLDIVQQGLNTLIRLGQDELAVLQNVRADQITAADFIQLDAVRANQITASAIAQSTDRRPAPVRGTNQADRLVGTSQADLLQGLGGNDGLFGNAGNDGLFGGAGDDVLFGGAGNDQLFGDAGSDTLTGGGGNDVFIAREGAGVDTIVDFRDSRDRIGIAPNVSFGQLDIVQQGRDTLIRLGQDELAVLQNVRADQITAADFIVT